MLLDAAMQKTTSVSLPPVNDEKSKSISPVAKKDLNRDLEETDHSVSKPTAPIMKKTVIRKA
jgi:hypothetical protein